MSAYETNFSLFINEGMSYTEIEDMMPWERDILVSQILQRNKEIEQAKNRRK